MSGRRWGTFALGAVVSACLIVCLAGCSTPAPTGTSGSTSSGGGASAGAIPGGTTIIEKNFQFSPSTLSVQVGDKITFSNHDSTAHHVVVGTADLGVQQPGQDVTWTAGKDGTFAIVCTIHPSMIGQVTVGAGGSSTTTSGTTGGAGSAAPPAGGSGGGGAPPGGSGGYGY